ncbi:Protein of unknown function, partial [Gryllus bimaculatus]
KSETWHRKKRRAWLLTRGKRGEGRTRLQASPCGRAQQHRQSGIKGLAEVECMCTGQEKGHRGCHPQTDEGLGPETAT